MEDKWMRVAAWGVVLAVLVATAVAEPVPSDAAADVETSKAHATHAVRTVPVRVKPLPPKIREELEQWKVKLRVAEDEEATATEQQESLQQEVERLQSRINKAKDKIQRFEEKESSLSSQLSKDETQLSQATTASDLAQQSLQTLKEAWLLRGHEYNQMLKDSPNSPELAAKQKAMEDAQSAFQNQAATLQTDVQERDGELTSQLKLKNKLALVKEKLALLRKRLRSLEKQLARNQKRLQELQTEAETAAIKVRRARTAIKRIKVHRRRHRLHKSRKTITTTITTTTASPSNDDAPTPAAATAAVDQPTAAAPTTTALEPSLRKELEERWQQTQQRVEHEVDTIMARMQQLAADEHAADKADYNAADQDLHRVLKDKLRVVQKLKRVELDKLNRLHEQVSRAMRRHDHTILEAQLVDDAQEKLDGLLATPAGEAPVTDRIAEGQDDDDEEEEGKAASQQDDDDEEQEEGQRALPSNEAEWAEAIAAADNLQAHPEQVTQLEEQQPAEEQDAASDSEQTDAASQQEEEEGEDEDNSSDTEASDDDDEEQDTESTAEDEEEEAEEREHDAEAAEHLKHQKKKIAKTKKQMKKLDADMERERAEAIEEVDRAAKRLEAKLLRRLRKLKHNTTPEAAATRKHLQKVLKRHRHMHKQAVLKMKKMLKPSKEAADDQHDASGDGKSSKAQRDSMQPDRDELEGQEKTNQYAQAKDFHLRKMLWLTTWVDSEAQGEEDQKALRDDVENEQGKAELAAKAERLEAKLSALNKRVLFHRTQAQEYQKAALKEQRLGHEDGYQTLHTLAVRHMSMTNFYIHSRVKVQNELGVARTALEHAALTNAAEDTTSDSDNSNSDSDSDESDSDDNNQADASDGDE